MAKDEPKSNGRKKDQNMQINNEYQAERRKVEELSFTYNLLGQMKKAVK